jgi:hypothetical protein
MPMLNWLTAIGCLGLPIWAFVVFAILLKFSRRPTQVDPPERQRGFPVMPSPNADRDESTE